MLRLRRPAPPSPTADARRRLAAAAVLASLGVAAAPAVANAAPDRVALNPTATPTTSQAITWRSADGSAGSVEVRRTGTADARTVLPGSSVVLRGARHQSATLSGLEPDTEYEYRVGDRSGRTAWTGFRTATRGLVAPWRWLSFGDAQEGLDVWGRWMGDAFRAVPDARLVMHVGDMVNAPNEDVEWAQWFGPQKGTVDRKNLFAIPGNHEYLGIKDALPFVDADPTAETFRAHFEHPRNGVAGLEDTNYTFEYQGVRFVALNTGDNIGYDPSPEQTRWLDDVLARNDARWTVVLFHIPAFSSSEDHHPRTARVRRSWLEILERRDVDLVLQGHTHAYGRGHVNGHPNGPQYVVSTSGPKYYALDETPGADWIRNGATPRIIAGETSTFETICVSQDRLALRSTIVGKGAATTTTKPVGDVLDAFTIHKGAGDKRVAEGYDCAADAPAAPPAAADPPLVSCQARPAVVTDVAPGRRDLVRAVAPVAHAGRTAVLERREGGRWRAAGRATVAASGALRFRASALPAARRAAARYRVRLAGARSATAARSQDARVTGLRRSGTRVRVSGRAGSAAGTSVRLRARTGCGAWRTVRTVRTTRGGRFTTTAPVSAGATLRAEATLRSGGRAVLVRGLGRTAP